MRGFVVLRRALNPEVERAERWKQISAELKAERDHAEAYVLVVERTTERYQEALREIAAFEIWGDEDDRDFLRKARDTARAALKQA